LFLHKTFKALNGLLCADVPLRNYSLTHSVHTQDDRTFLREMTSWPPFWKYDVISKSDSVNRCIFSWRTILPNCFL